MSVESPNMDTFNQVLANLRSRKAFIRLLDPDEATHINLGDLGDLIAGNAKHFRAQGVNPGDSVAISLKNDLEHIVSFLALVALGAIPVSIKPARTMTPSYIEETSRLCNLYEINHCYHTLALNSRTRLIHWQAKPINQNRSVIIETQPDDVAFVQFSSGSTGTPKPIPITHGNLMANLLTILCVETRKPEETAFNFLPLSHDMGLIGGLLSNLVLQNSLLLTGPSQFLRHPIEVLKIGQQYNIGGLAMPDFSLRHLGRMLELTRTDRVPTRLFAGIRFIYCGAETIRFETIDRFIAAALPLGLNPRALFLCYGLAEATLLVAGGHFDSMQTSFDHRATGQPLACVGRALGNFEIRIGEPDEHNGDVSHVEGREGPIHLRGPSVFPGYWKERPRPKDGWFRTGDIGRFRAGNLYISGR
ncbi:MAG TPA: AMP-binding protein, partial [Pyrinomonadaceae bacterium]|nr:AMP-binding protein [Pyrinomonadaceae bacterium]